MINLLIVDDELHLVDSLVETIDWREAGIGEVRKAYSGSEALQVMNTEPIDIVITDIRMPGMSGLELICRIRESWKRTKLILLTGYADFEYAQQALNQQVSAYLIKPVADSEILEAVRRMAEKAQEEWQAVASLERAAFLRDENLPLIRDRLLNELLQGARFSSGELEQKLEAYELPIRAGGHCALLTVRLEQGFEAEGGQSLYEYAVCNIVEEVFGEDFRLWRCRDPHDLLVFLAAKRELKSEDDWPQQQFAELAVQVQYQVKAYLKGSVSVVAGRSGRFPDEAPSLYQTALTVVRRAVGAESNVFFSEGDVPDTVEMRTIRSLYEHPTLPYLLEVGSWERIDSRLNAIFEELDADWSASQEHLIEVFSYLLHAFSFIAHKNGKGLAELAKESYEKVFGGTPLRSSRALREWAEDILTSIRCDMETEVRDTRSALVLKAQVYIREHLHTDVTLPAIADNVHLHPVYLSRIFKAVTGENVSDYVHKLRMERAAYLLKNTDKKVYEITELVGYENPQYFSKVFRKIYGQTPLEYRDTFSSFQQDPRL
ncbi:response regulator [Paenibacillus macerans]|uniref:response regulator transcription factor n=1 Tax=Paenibacillus macerans TaxID=44252 RepID=UPI003D318CA4